MNACTTISQAMELLFKGGGGKRDIHSFEHYDRTTGISVYRSPAVHVELAYFYVVEGVPKMAT